MSTRQKVLIGGLGALAPIVMSLLAIDLEVLLLNFTVLAFLGYGIRVVLLFSVGGFFAFLHKNENSPLRVFELGIVAPALITTLLSAGQVEVPKAVPKPNPASPTSALFIPSAYAQDAEREGVKTFSLPQEAWTQQFLRGLTGSTTKKLWFVIAGTHAQLEGAREQARRINQEGKGFKAEVYAPYGGSPQYSVVIGAHLTYEDAQQLRARAIAAGFPQETHLWTFPKAQ